MREYRAVQNVFQTGRKMTVHVRQCQNAIISEDARFAFLFDDGPAMCFALIA
jgi:hypothetical protein